MVVSRNGGGSGGTAVHPCIKESGVSQSRPITKRVAELPSLRYGTLGAKSNTTGPLRVTTHYHNDTLPKTKKKAAISYGYEEDGYNRPSRPLRRVRFSLPATDGDSNSNGVATRRPGAAATSNSGNNKPTAGADNINRPRFHQGGAAPPPPPPPRSAASPAVVSALSRRSDARRSESAGRFCPPQSSDHNANFFDPPTTSSLSNFRETYNSSYNYHQHHPEPAHPAASYWGNSSYWASSTSFGGASAPGVQVTNSPGVRSRVHPTGRYVRGTLSPTANAAAASPHAAVAAQGGGQVLLRAARDADDLLLRDLLRRAALMGISEADLNAADSSGRTVLSYVASNGSIELLEQILQLPGLNPNKPDNEGNTPLHFAAQAGQVECVNCLLSRCRGIEIDARNNLGFTPLMKAALQGRNKCAKLLLFAGANPTLRDNGRGFRADQWARFCGRYICADVIEKHARQRLLERSTSYGNWGGEHEQLGARVLMGKVVPVPPIPQQPSNGLKSKLKRVFRTSSGLGQQTNDAYSSARLVTQLTSAALCASSPVLPSGPAGVPPMVKSLIRPLTVPKLQITLVNNNGDYPNNNLPSNGIIKTADKGSEKSHKSVTVVAPSEAAAAVKPVRTKKKK